jgi:hypothetical protein
MSKLNSSVRNCTFLDYLQNCGKQERLCKIEYTQHDGSAVSLSSPIVDLFSWQGSDYLLLDKGQLIRLDRVVRVNDTSAAG